MRMVATDLDGTIIPHGGTISPRTKAALAACHDADIRVVFVTGRPPRWLTPVVDATGHTGHAVCANGAIVLDVARDVPVTVHGIPAETVLEVADRLRRAVPDVIFGVETPRQFRTEAPYDAVRSVTRTEGHRPEHDSAAYLYGDDLTDLLDDEPVIKLVAISPSARPDQLLAVGREQVASLVTPTHSSVELAMLEMSARGVTKATTLAELAASWGIAPSDVVAFGDMPNDVDMLRWAGRGYAMADGHAEALAAAAYQAPAAAADGVAQVLEGLLAEI